MAKAKGLGDNPIMVEFYKGTEMILGHGGRDIETIAKKFQGNAQQKRLIFKDEFKSGDEKVLKSGTKEYKNLEYMAKKLNGHVDDIYLDHSQNWMWTTIVRGNVQLLSPRAWQNIVNASSTDELDKISIVNGYIKDSSVNKANIIVTGVNGK